MSDFALTPEMLAGIAGAVISLIFSFIPGLNTKFAALPTETQRLVMAGILLVTAFVVYLLGCAAIVVTGIACTQAGAVQLVWMFITAIITNQGVYQITPQTASVKAIRSERTTQTPDGPMLP